MTGKLTPRVGDRVTFQLGGKTYAGNLVYPPTTPNPPSAEYDHWSVVVDGSDRHWYVSALQLTVVDREPVEWPEGWGPSYAGCVRVTTVPGLESFNVDRPAFDAIRGPEGDYVAEHWDELMGES